LIDIRKLKELVRLMVENDLSEIDLGDEHEKVVVKRGLAGGVVYGPHPGAMAPMHHGYAPGAHAPPGGAHAADDGPEASTDDDLHAIVSPMVGTFYSGPDPESPAFIKPGTDVSADSVVCIVEAMKVFSEIKAECTGTVEKVLVKNGEAVEYGQKLFLVRTK
jgi:acetyl-CoA carboxylase biotin carboxyl carrier protein